MTQQGSSEGLSLTRLVDVCDLVLEDHPGSHRQGKTEQFIDRGAVRRYAYRHVGGPHTRNTHKNR
jgi:hypothetical protein